MSTQVLGHGLELLNIMKAKVLLGLGFLGKYAVRVYRRDVSSMAVVREQPDDTRPFTSGLTSVSSQDPKTWDPKLLESTIGKANTEREMKQVLETLSW